MLVLDTPLVLVHPLPHTLKKGLTTNFMAVRALLSQQAFDNGLRRNTRVIFARHPQGIVSQHAMIANKNVFDSRRDGMTQVQRARDIGWRHTDDKGFTSRTRAWLKVATFFPETIPFTLNRLRLVGFRQRLRLECCIGRTIILLDHDPSWTQYHKFCVPTLFCSHIKNPSPSRTRKGVNSWYHLVLINPFTIDPCVVR